MAIEPEALQAGIGAAKAGRQEGYRCILAAYGPRLYGYFYRATGDHHDAEDLLGEVMLRLVRSLKAYDDRGRFESWLFRIAANLVRDRFRRRKAVPPTVSLSGRSEEAGAVPVPAASAPVDEGLMADEAGEQLMAALARLDETTRHMILLRHFAQMSFAEIAEWMDCPLGTALSTVHRGLKALRKELRPRAGEAGRDGG